ncbi:MAG TPA: hypothetical protein VF297_21140 [Pyrinomonadaceae bacterium]
MNSVITSMYKMFVCVQDFAVERPVLFPAGSLGAEASVELRKAVEDMTEAATTQTSGLSSVQRATAERMTAREVLRQRLQAMVRTARVMAIDTPGLENKFRLPRSSSDQALLQAARAFVADAVPLKDEFLRHGMDGSFIEDFKEEIADLERAMGQQNTGRGTHVSATVSVESMAERGMNAVRRIDAFIHNTCGDDKATLAAWKSARHIESPTRKRKRSNGGEGGDKPEDDQNS